MAVGIIGGVIALVGQYSDWPEDLKLRIGMALGGLVLVFAGFYGWMRLGCAWPGQGSTREWASRRRPFARIVTRPRDRLFYVGTGRPRRRAPDTDL